MAKVRDFVGEPQFDGWVASRLPFSSQEARTLIGFAEDAAVQAVDVSPVRAMTLTKAAQLFHVLCKPLRGGGDHRRCFPAS